MCGAGEKKRGGKKTKKKCAQKCGDGKPHKVAVGGTKRTNDELRAEGGKGEMFHTITAQNTDRQVEMGVQMFLAELQ